MAASRPARQLGEWLESGELRRSSLQSAMSG